MEKVGPISLCRTLATRVAATFQRMAMATHSDGNVSFGLITLIEDSVK
jgi:hypothetical protein